ncbi:MAG: hypothetical protein C0607_14205 [Azoarcus sp.]|nr:MAG: hypothetical protein C0607_14205 [Azoarcus sp.]
MYASSQATLITTGVLPFLLLVSAVLTAPVSIALLALYRRAVLRSMAISSAAAPEVGDGSPLAPPRAGLRLCMVDAGALPEPRARTTIQRSLVMASLVYGAAGFTYALVLGGAWMIQTRADGFVVIRFLLLLSCYAWPAALAIGLLVAVNLKQRLIVACAYFVMLFAVAIYGLLRNDALSVGQVASFWMLTNAPATILLLAFLHRRVRAVGPLVLAFMVVVVTGSQVALTLVGSSEAGMRAAVLTGAAVGLGGEATLFATMLLGALLAAVAGWFCLKWLGHRHLARRSSDQALTLDAMWLLFGMVQSITLAFEGWVWILTGPVAFAGYKAVSTAGFRASGLHRAPLHPPSLLLLRVFALGARSGQLFDALSRRWLRTGDISMIAGPDLATSTVEPHEFLDFVGGRLSRQFVRDADDLEQRLQAAARGPDPDGRYRINEFFCHANTWQLAMRRLAASSDAVLMDLRSFSAANQGCQYELQQLIDIVPLDRVLFLVDASTDKAFLERSLLDLWSRAASDSPNREHPTPRANIVDIGKRVETIIPPLLGLLDTPQLQPAAGAG